MSITASDVKQLRDKTGAGMMDAKKALTEAGGDMEAAVDWLRQKGLATAQKKSGRTAADGLVAVVSNATEGAIVEVNAETDFVARNEGFQEFVQNVCAVAAEGEASVEQVLAASYPGASHSVQDELTELIAKIGENMTLRRVQKLSVSEGIVATYVHNAVVPGMGKIGVLVALESSADAEKLAAFARQLAMHIAAANPLALTQDSLDPQIIERERQVLIEQAKESGKPQEIAEKMVEGRMRKYYEEVVLLDQTYIIDGESKISQLLEKEASNLGGSVQIAGFVRFALGEGIDKEEDNFAEEVKKMAS